MADIVLFTAGTLGDHLPFVALGVALRGRGHRVRLAINSAMVPVARRSGLEAVALTDIERGPDEARENAWAWNHWQEAPAPPEPGIMDREMRNYASQVRELTALARESDLLVTTAIRPHGHFAHRASGVPWLTVSLNPAAFSRPRVEQLREAAAAEHRRRVAAMTEVNRHLLTELGIAGDLPPWRPGWLLARHVLLASSPRFSRPDRQQLQPEASLDLTGFWFYEDPEWGSWEPDAALSAFCAGGPLVLAFSSQPLEDPGRVLDMHVRAARALGVPLLVQEGWAGFGRAVLGEPEGDDVRFAPFLPQDWLFARAAATIQHGGVGSIARALRQGCPLLVEPFGNDQIFNAHRVQALGVGAAAHPFETSAEQIARVLEKRVLGEGCRARAREMAEALREEDGLGRACDLIEIGIERARRGGGVSRTGVAALGEPDAGAKPPSPALSPGGGRDGGPSSMPRIIHQVWTGDGIPPATAARIASWGKHHPGWEHRLWRGADLLEFLERHFPWFLPVYHGYPEEGMRVDAAGYLLLSRFGGILAGVDSECLRSLEPLLEGRSLLLAEEPPSPVRERWERTETISRFLDPSLVASAPGHPFWEHLIRELVASHDAADPHEATGPLLLSRAFERFPGGEGIRIEEAGRFPAAACAPAGASSGVTEGSGPPVEAFALRHAGGRRRPGPPSRDDGMPVSLLLRGSVVLTAPLETRGIVEQLAGPGRTPVVSCIAVADGKGDLRRAVRCFQAQTWPARELVIVDRGPAADLEDWIARLNDPAVSHHRLRGGGTLGGLLDAAVERSRGEYVALWGDGLSSPERLRVQLAALLALAGDACMLERHTLLWRQGERIAYSASRPWEPSLVCRRDAVGRFPAVDRDPEAGVVERLVARGRVALVDRPLLLIRVLPGDGGRGGEPGERRPQAVSERFEGGLFRAAMLRLQELLGPELSGLL